MSILSRVKPDHLWTCKLCGIQFLRPKTKFRGEYPQYCSRSCAALSAIRPPEERFWQRVNKSGPVALQGIGECWLWKLSTVSSPGRGGHGRFSLGYGWVLAHRFAWEMVAGSNPEGMRVCHICDVRNCVRNDGWGVYVVDGVEYQRRGHLFLATAKANSRDMVLKGRAATGEKNGTRTHPPQRAGNGRYLQASNAALEHAPFPF